MEIGYRITKLDSSGDTALLEPGVHEPETLEQVQKEFNRLMESGYSAFLSEQPGEPATRIKNLDKVTSGTVVIIPQIKGG